MKKIFVIILLFCFAQIAIAQKLSQEFDALMSEVFTTDGPGGVALVVKGDKVLYRKAFGMANLELGVKMKPENIFRIGSLSKQFTAIAVLKLRDEGKLDLDDDITKYLKDYPTYGHEITIKHLLSHTSGISTGIPGIDNRKDYTPEEIIELFKYQPMDFIPGEKKKYNNKGYFILGYIIEIVSGMPYAEYIESALFKPIKMTSSYYDVSSRITTDRAYGYKKSDKYMNADFKSMTIPYAGGALQSSVDDLYKWYNAIIADKVISKSSREEAHSSAILNNGKKTGYGYGWAIGNIQGSPQITHKGGINGYKAVAKYLPEERLFVAILTNCECFIPGTIATKMAALAIGKPFRWKKIRMEDAALEDYEAVYESDEKRQWIITYKDGQLFSYRRGKSKLEIFPFTKDKFFFEYGMTTLHFNRDSNNQIISVTTKSTGYDVVWKKTNIPIPLKAKIHIDPSVKAKYFGKYELTPDFIISIFEEKGIMFTQGTGQPKFEIVQFEENKFRLEGVDAKLTFNRDKSGKVISLTLHQGGDNDAKKIK